MGLGFLGRGRARNALLPGLVHAAGGVLGGGGVGAIAGLVGQVLPVSRGQPLILGLALGFALLVHSKRSVGRRAQVPRRWRETVPVVPRYFLWGMLLGSGVATIIPYSIFLVLLGAELTAGVGLAAGAGAMYGGVRSLASIVPLCQARFRIAPDAYMKLLPKLRSPLKLANFVGVVIVGSILLLSRIAME